MKNTTTIPLNDIGDDKREPNVRGAIAATVPESKSNESAR